MATIENITLCVHAIDEGRLAQGQVGCRRGVFRPSKSKCDRCPMYAGPPRPELAAPHAGDCDGCNRKRSQPTPPTSRAAWFKAFDDSTRS